MLNKDDLIIPVNEYVSAATINLDCIDVCENIAEQLFYLHECVENIDIVMLQGCSTRIPDLLDEIKIDIVNIGLHFILKNVRPYAASCSEA